MQLSNCLNWFKPVATGDNWFLERFNWLELVLTGLNRLQPVVAGSSNVLHWFEVV